MAQIREWTVDYGDGRRPVSVPHAWRQDVPVAWEGPAAYETSLVASGKWLRFRGVSYEARVFVEGTLATEHRGIWDAFQVDLGPWLGRTVAVRVEVVKNGGGKFPVRKVLSGFLPYVYHTFGGIFGEVLATDEPMELGLPPRPALEVRGPQLFRDGKHLTIRGLLHWGWYPDLGHTNPPEELVRQEVREAKRLGFNLVKFCLWVPPHRYLEILEEEGMLGWLELPIWDPDPVALPEIEAEVERIVLQYRHHRSIAIWTVGCELSQGTPPEFRQRLVEMVRRHTGCPLVKDNSGGSEMYGGSLQEFGDFHDYHPYCDTPFYGPVLEGLLNGPRSPKPILLGEFNDIDVHRDLPRLADASPYWASADPALNAQGVRWQQDLPNFIRRTPFALDNDRSDALAASSRDKALFIRKHVHELVRQQRDIAGYVVTGWRDTPISTAGFFDDFGVAHFTPEECAPWNTEASLFRIPMRRPPWVDGGNRPGWRSLSCFFEDEGLFLKLGGSGVVGPTAWRVLDARAGVVVAEGEFEPTSSAAPTELGEIALDLSPGQYVVRAVAQNAWNQWDVLVGRRPDAGEWNRVTECPTTPRDRVVFLEQAGTVRRPFWREAAYEFAGDPMPWHALLDVSPDRAIDRGWINETYPDAGINVLLNRIDTRTYEELPVLLELSEGGAVQYVTTLRPWGGLGAQPQTVRWNPAGAWLLESLLCGGPDPLGFAGRIG